MLYQVKSGMWQRPLNKVSSSTRLCEHQIVNKSIQYDEEPCVVTIQIIDQLNVTGVL